MAAIGALFALAMTAAMWIVVVVTAITFGVMATGWIRSELAALGGCCALVLTGVLSTSELFPALGSDAVVTVGAMFVLSAALERTGVIDSVSRFLQRLPLRTEFTTLGLLLPAIVGVSAFVNHTPVVVVFLPIILSIARRNQLMASKLLIPVSFASILGGSMTLIGTSTNLVASTAGMHSGLRPIGMFELAAPGLAITAAGLVYLLVVARWIPERQTVTGLLDENTQRSFLTEAFVPAGSALVGRTGTEALAHIHAQGRIVELVRDGEIVEWNGGAVLLAAGDRLRINVSAETVSVLKHRRSLRLNAPGNADLAFGDAAETRLVECVVRPRSSLLGRELGDTDLPRRAGLMVLALHRAGENLRAKLDSVVIESGDVLLIEATETALGGLRQSGDLLVLAGSHRMPRRRKRWIALLLIAAVVSLTAWQIVPITVAAITAAILAVVCGCIEAPDAYRAIDWPTLLLIAGTLALGTALEKSHTAEFAARLLIGRVAELGPWVSLSLMVFLASALTNFLSNNVVAALLVPLAVEAAHVLHASPRPFLMAVVFGAAACYATPISCHTNTLVYAAGGYRFADFVRFGLPLNILHGVLATLLIPVFWPL